MKKTVAGIGLGIWPTELPCGRAWGHDGYIVDYQTLVSASEEGDRVAVVSLRGRIHTVARESAALRGASPCGGLCASKVEDRVCQRSWPPPRRSTS